MRKRQISAVLLGIMILLSGCGRETEQRKEEISKQEHKVQTNIEEKEEGGYRSSLTGLPVEEQVSRNRPLAVMFNNIKEGCPQTAISEAEIVYEAPVEGRITRLMGLYEEYDHLEEIGSIRSSRDYFVYFAMEYDAIYSHFGQANPYVADLLNSDRVDNISGQVAGIDRPAIKSFYRSNDRKAPHNVYLTIEGLLQDLKKFDYRLTKKDGLIQKLSFTDEEHQQTFPYAEEASILYPGGKDTSKENGFSRVQARFEYNEEDGKYYRYQYGGEHIDDLTGEILTYDNVIFQYCHGEVRDDNDYLAFGCHDEGRMVRVFTEGKMIPGIWNRTSDEEPASYIDYEGDPILLKPGKTWICIIWDEYRDDVVYE